MAEDNQLKFVQAIYPYKGKNNDELCFKKGDIITVTQLEEGGWWEGTLDGKTGWFPSNYVKEYVVASKSLSPIKTNVDMNVHLKENRSVVLNDFIDTEKKHIMELQNLITTFFQPLEKVAILSKTEYLQLLNNLKEVIAVHEELLSGLEVAAAKPPTEQRVGKFVMSLALKLKKIHHTYCAGHPTAANILTSHKEKLGEVLEKECGASILAFTSGLSLPFRRLDAYSNKLQELERQMEESHPDRGETQRAVSVYNDIAVSCKVLRRKKEMELEIINGGVRGWEGQDVSSLGNIVHMGSVAVAPDLKDRYFVLFSSTLLMLSASQRMSAFVYEGKLPLAGIIVNKLEDTDVYKNAFEIAGPLIDKILAICQTKEDMHKWVEVIKDQCRIHGAKTAHVSSLSKLSSLEDLSSDTPWSISRLRPLAPTKYNLLRADKMGSPRQGDSNHGTSDAPILNLIESYCSSASARYTLTSDSMDIAEGFLENSKFDCCSKSSQDDSSFIDTLIMLKDEVSTLNKEIASIKENLSEEKDARVKLETIITSQRLLPKVPTVNGSDAAS